MNAKVKKGGLPVRQLAILCLCRLGEPLVLTSIPLYLPVALESFGVVSYDIAKWASRSTAVFSVFSCVSALFWGRASDTFGRRPTLIAGSLMTTISILSLGFSRNIVFFFISISMIGISCGNIANLRTITAELVTQSDLQPTAFGLLPMMWLVGAFLGPVIGAHLANPTKSYPGLFKESKFLESIPWILPNVIIAMMPAMGFLGSCLWLKETIKHHQPYRASIYLGSLYAIPFLGTFCMKVIRKLFPGFTQQDEREFLEQNSESVLMSEFNSEDGHEHEETAVEIHHKTSMFNSQSSLSTVAYVLLSMHSVVFDEMLAVFLYTRRASKAAGKNGGTNARLGFGGGTGLEEKEIGDLFAACGIVAILTQLTVYPRIVTVFGPVGVFKVCSMIYPVVYLAIPFVIRLEPQSWAESTVILLLMLIKSLCSTFAFPCISIVLSKSVASLNLGKLNGVASSIAQMSRACGYLFIGAMFTFGLKIELIILPWWILSFFALMGMVPVFYLKSPSPHLLGPGYFGGS